MSAREKDKILYSRNGIKIIKTENLKNKTYGVSRASRIEQLENVIGGQTKNNNTSYKVKHESKLGFYYYTTHYDSKINNKPKSVYYHIFIIYAGDIKYELSYPYKYSNNWDEQRINREMRPWDICPGYKGIPDHMIQALYKETINFLNILADIKSGSEFENLKDEIMIDLFGNTEGPEIQSNNIKILSHGFDLKTSFRKPKES